MKTYVDYVYEIIKAENEGVDALYKDYIVHCVGNSGFNALMENKLLESCGAMYGRQLYVLCEKQEVEKC